MDVIETNLEDMQAQKEDEEYEQEDAENCPYSDEEIDAEKADLDGAHCQSRILSTKKKKLI